MMKGIKNLNQLVTLEKVHQKDGRYVAIEDLGIIPHGAVIFDQHKIIWCGPTKAIPKDYQHIKFFEGSGHVLTPEIVDSHTHLVFGGHRAQEYSLRLNGADYQAIAKAGGGILSTMRGTNNTSRNDLFQLAVSRIERIHSLGIGTIEIKSGYGLNEKKEIECSEIIHDLKEFFKNKVQIFNTFMAAHAIPPDFSSGRSYLEKVVFPTMEKLKIKNILDAADIFHEVGYFSAEDAKLFYDKCQELKLPFKAHVDEFQDNKGAILAAQAGALSVDHLLNTGHDGIEVLASSQTVATLLPGTGFFLGKPQAKARELLDRGVKLALASDFNPGSCHCDNLILIASMAAPQLKINLAELWTAITHNAAHALGLTNQGAVLPGLKPRFSLFKTSQIDEITYSWGKNLANSEFLSQVYSY